MKDIGKTLVKSRFGGKDVFGFKGQSQLYQEYRQNHPEIYVEKVSREVGNNVMIDVGCGTGQLCRMFAKKFKRIYGIDASESQLDTAREANKDLEKTVSFHYQDCHDIGKFCKEEIGKKIDLVTFGQVFHWLEADVIFEHYKQFMAENGALAIFSYATPKIMNSELAKAITEEKKDKESEFNYFGMSTLVHADKYKSENLEAHDAFWNYYTNNKVLTIFKIFKNLFIILFF